MNESGKTASAMVANASSASWSDYFELCKPRVVSLILVTAIIGMCLASPGTISPSILIFATLGIGLAASSAAAINHILDQQIDNIMHRTQKRPMPTGKISTFNASIFALLMGTLGMLVLVDFVNVLTAKLTFLTLIGYAIIYTAILKRMTPQNIVIGGIAGAAPPLLGWTAVTGQIEPNALLLVLIIFTWTPPHFWALAIYRYADYKRAKIPMLPITHGIPFTKLSILLYTYLMVASTFLPYVTQMSGVLYLAASLCLNARFIYLAHALYRTDNPEIAWKTFRFSIVYLFALFTALLVDHYFT